MSEQPYWRAKKLWEMSKREWEALCDGCGKCCLLKLEDEEDGQVDHTDVVCWLLDRTSCRCGNYTERKKHVPDCVILSPGKVARLKWMPATCAYRLVHEGQDLPWWHPLVSGDPETVHAAGMSVRGRCVSERKVADRDLEDHIVYWPDL